MIVSGGLNRAAQDWQFNSHGFGRSSSRSLNQTLLARELLRVHCRFLNRAGDCFDDRRDDENARAGKKNALRLPGNFRGSKDPATPQILALSAQAFNSTQDDNAEAKAMEPRPNPISLRSLRSLRQ